MPPFQYSGYRNPYVQSISQLIEAPGQIEAQRAQTAGNAWANAAQTAGQAVGQIPAQMNAAKMQALQMQDVQAQVAERNAIAAERAQKQKDLKDFDTALATPGGRQAVLKNTPGHLQAQVLESFKKADELGANARKAAEDARKAQQEHIGYLGAQIKIHNYDPAAALPALHQAREMYADDPEMLKQIDAMRMQVIEQPESIRGIADAAILGSSYKDMLKEEKPTDASLALTANDPTKTPEQRTAAKAALEDLNAPKVADRLARQQQADARLKQSEAVLAETARAHAQTAKHESAMEAAANPLAAIQGAVQGGKAGAAPAGIHGEDFLKGLPAPLASEVKAYAEGRRPFPSGAALRSPYFQSLLQMVGEYDPTFDAANYNARNKARTDLTNASGQGGRIVNSLNTAIQHAGRLSDLIEALGNTDLPAANAVMNLWNKTTGGTKVTNFEAVQPQMMKEIERLWRGAGGASGDIEQLKNSLGKNMGIQQQREALSQFVELMRGKLDATETQRDNVLGPAAKDIPIIFPQSKPVLDKITQRATPTKAGSASAAPKVGDTVSVKGKNIKITAIHSDGSFDGEPVK